MFVALILLHMQCACACLFVLYTSLCLNDHALSLENERSPRITLSHLLASTLSLDIDIIVMNHILLHYVALLSDTRVLTDRA